MSGMTVGLLALGVTLLLLVFRIHIGLTMLIGGMLPYLLSITGILPPCSSPSITWSIPGYPTTTWPSSPYLY